MKRLLPALLALCLASACASTPKQPQGYFMRTDGRSMRLHPELAAPFNASKYKCLREAKGMPAPTLEQVPANTRVVQNNNNANGYGNNYGGGNWGGDFSESFESGARAGALIRNSRRINAHQAEEVAFFKTCMLAEGYEYRTGPMPSVPRDEQRPGRKTLGDGPAVTPGISETDMSDQLGGK